MQKDPIKFDFSDIVEENPSEQSDFDFSDIVEPSPEKKSSVGSPSQGGLQGSQDGITVPSGGIEVPDRPLTGQLASLPPIGSLIDIDPSRPTPVSDPRKLSQEIEKAALSQAGLKPDDFRKKANDAVRQKELGEVEMEMYVVDGKAIPAERFKDLIFDQKFIDETQKGLHNVQINPSKNEYVSQFLDKNLVDAANRNLQSGTRTGDKWESFMSGAARAASGVAGMETMYYDVVEEVLGIPLRRDLFGVAELQETSEELAKKSEEYQKKTFQYRENFLNSVLEGKWSDAAQQAGDATAASVPYSAGAAALTYAGGPALAFSVLAPMSSSAEYASMKVSEDQAFMQLSRAEKLLRSNVVGPLEAATDIVAGRAISRSFDLTKSLYKGLVKEVAEKQGLEAADKAAKELSKNVIKKYGENIGLQMAEEFFAEGGSTAGTMLYDDLMGIRSYDAKDYISEILNSGLLGSASGGITTGVLGGPAAIYATGLTATNKLKSVFDKKLYEDPSAVENLSKRVDSMKVSNEVKEDLKENLAKREKAVKAVPEDKVSDTETVDTVQEIQELEERKKGLLPVYQEPIQAEIDAKTEKLKEGIGKDKPRLDKEWGTNEGNEALSDAARRDFLYVIPMEEVDGKMQLKEKTSPKIVAEQSDRMRVSATMDSIIERGIKNGLSAEDIIGELADRGFRVGGARSNMRPKEYVQARIDGKEVPTLREIFGYDRLTDTGVVYETDTERRETPVNPAPSEVAPTETVEQAEEVAPADGGIELDVENNIFNWRNQLWEGVKEGKPFEDEPYLYRAMSKEEYDNLNAGGETIPQLGEKLVFVTEDVDRVSDEGGSYGGKKQGGVIVRIKNKPTSEIESRTVNGLKEKGIDKISKNDIVSVWDAKSGDKIFQAEALEQPSQPTPPTDAVQEQSTESVPVRQQPEARQGVREEDAQGQEAPQEGEAVREEVVEDQDEAAQKWEIVRGADTPLGKSYSIRNKETGEKFPLAFNSKEQAQKQIDFLSKPKVSADSTLEAEAKQELVADEILMSGEAQKRRQEGKYEKDGIIFERNPEKDGPKGSTGNVRFAQGEQEMPFTFRLIEADELQPSHINGRRNPLHFLPEAQPKTRDDAASIKAEDDIAANPRLDLVGEDTGAYSGAPIVNKRGEVVQGNNRAAGLKKTYQRNNPSYKQQLAERAGEFGLTKEQVDGMKNPVLVREVAFSDDAAIRFGNYKAADLETGGKSSIDPVTVSARMPLEAKQNMLGMLFTDGATTLKAAIRDNFKRAAQAIYPYINAAQKNSIERTTTPSQKQMTEMEGVVLQFLFDGGDPNLSQMFEGLSATQQGSILKAMPDLFSVSRDKSIVPEVQSAIGAATSFETSGVADFDAWAVQSDMFNGNMSPSDVYTPTEMALAKILAESSNQSAFANAVRNYTEQVKGSSGDMFTPPTEGITKEEALKKQFNDGTGGKKTVGAATPTMAPKKEDAKEDKPTRKPREPKPSKPKVAETEVDADIERLEKQAAERKALADRIRSLKSDGGKMMSAIDFGITEKLYNAAIDIIADQVEKGTAIGKAVQSAVEFIEKELEGAPWKRKEFEESITGVASEEAPTPEKAPKKERKPKTKSKKRYTARTVKALAELKGKEELEQAIRDTGLSQEIVPWKKVQPIATEIVEDVFSDPKDVDAKANDFYNEVLTTTNKDYIDNRELSTLHALTFHMMLDRMANEGLDNLYVKYSSLFQDIGSGKGRFISAMQQDASPYALMNLKIRPIYEGMNRALDTVTDTGSTRFEEIAKVKELVDELLAKDELLEAYRKKVSILAERLDKAQTNQTLGASFTEAPKQKLRGKARANAGRKMFLEGLRDARGQLSAGLPINEKMLNGIKEMIAGLIDEGMYEVSRIKKSLMKDVNEQLKGQPDAIIDLAAAIDTYLQSEEFEDSRKEAMKAAFVESLENRAKSLMGNKRATDKTAEQVLLDTLLQKMGQEIGKDAAKGSKAYEQRLKAALENLEFSDDVWKAAVSNVKTWLERQDMDPVRKAEILARLEDSASLFMDQPFAKSDLRKAIRDGEKEIGVAVQDVVKQHWTKQNRTLESLAEKLVSELGLNAETAKKYEQAVMEEAKEYMNEKRLAAIRQALNLDSNGLKKERADAVSKRVIDRIIEAINLGMLDNNAFRGFFAEKYGIVELTPKDIRMMKHLNDLINIHEGTDISRRYTKELADYVETLKPWTATRVMMAWQGMTIKGMLSGLSTIAVNIPIGSIYSFAVATMPTIISNPIAFKEFMSEYSKAGLSKTGLKTFWDVLVEGYSPQEDGLGSKYDERDVHGDPIDYALRNFDKEKLWKEVREAKSPKEAAKKFGIMFAKGYLQVYRLANFAKAFDVLLSTRGVEFDLFLKYWNEESKSAGHPLRGKFDPNVSKKFIDKVREKMAYDAETRKSIEASVDEQIAGMKARGEKVGISYRQTLIRESMIAKRSMEDYKKAKERFASYLLMEQPTGLLSYVYDPVTKNMAIKESDSVVAAAGKLGFNLTIGLFLRISITAAQRGMENIPVAGLAMPGILYDRVPSDPINPRSEKEWQTFLNKKYDREQMKRRLMTHASVAVLAGIVAMNMFRLEDDEEEEQQEDGTFKVVKKTRIVENPNKVFDVTGFSGEFFRTEQFNEQNTPRKDYYFRVKVGDKWHNAVPLRLAPHFLFPVSVLGGMSDDLKFNPNKDRRKREVLVQSMDDFALAWSEMSFATIPKTTKQLYFASQRGAAEGLMEVGEIVVRPARTAIYPNAYRDVYKEMKFLVGAEEKMSQGLLSPVTNDVPFLEDYMGESSYDIFGYPKKVTSKLIQSAEDAPGVGMFVDSFIDYTAKNQERFETEAWQRKMKYFPNVEVKGYWPSGFDYETKVRASQLYGEMLREKIEAIPQETLDKADNPAKAIDTWLNGKVKYDGTQSGGIHSKITAQVREQLGIERLDAVKKEEFKLRNAVRAVIDGEGDKSKLPSIEELLKRLESTSKEKEALEEELKPKKK